ncbi:aat family amino acid transporter [Fusarium longipes]|uniref:Aat family amino acid transporter n=1 Tax=Fusarium longipes TaxID=694270 RepID=A0A395SYG3_9HYPO|nr:aat family amino acid transporter [Fusarium longipes]
MAGRKKDFDMEETSDETRQCQAVEIILDDEDEKRSITVVDTPGFDDTERSQADILAEITNYLTAQLTEVPRNSGPGASFSDRVSTMSKIKRIFQPNKPVKQFAAGAKSLPDLPGRSLSLTRHPRPNFSQEEQFQYCSISHETDDASHIMPQHIIHARKSIPSMQQKANDDDKSHNHTPQHLQLVPFTGIGNISEELGLAQRYTTDTDTTTIRKLKDSFAHQLRDKSDDIRQLQQDNETLKRQCGEAADKTYQPQAQLPLNRPESELVKDWHTLVYNVNNFVENHFRDEVAEAPQDIVISRESGLALIKATLWNALKRSTFGGVAPGGSMRWAGHYRGDILSVLQASEQRDQEVDLVVIDIDEILASCRNQISRASNYHRDLQALVNKAIEMDRSLSGQTATYCIDWPNSGRGSVKFDQTSMALAMGSPAVSRNSVKFVTQPVLYRLDRQGDSYNGFIVLDRSRVWMT